MNEYFIHFLWQTLRFEVRDLTTTAGEPLQIIRRGMTNPNQGADFLGAEVRIGETVWHGAVEMHLHSAEWYAHGHHTDEKYNHVMLHVVWQAGNRPIMRQDGSEVPELVLGHRVSPEILSRYHALQTAKEAIPCAALLEAVPQVVRQTWIERLGIERQQQRAAALQPRLLHTDWQQVLWEEMAAYMGGNPNREAFREIAQRLPFRVVAHHAGSSLQVEAMLFGVAGLLLDIPEDDAYAARLRVEWDFLRQKHGLQVASITLRWARMYPAAFPTIRLSQLGQVVVCVPALTRLLEPSGFAYWLKTEIPTGAYWREHLKFGQPATRIPSALGATAKHAVLSNAILPLAVLYAHAHGNEEVAELIEAALSLLPAEDNSITRSYIALGFTNTHALQSQGIVLLQKEYCASKKCLQCAIGQCIVGR